MRGHHGGLHVVERKAREQGMKLVDTATQLVELIEQAQAIADDARLNIVAAHLDSALISAQRALITRD